MTLTLKLVILSEGPHRGPESKDLRLLLHSEGTE